MRWPLVSRAAHDYATGSAGRWHQVATDLRVELNRERERYDGLVKEIIALRREGYEPPVVVPVPQVKPVQLIPPVVAQAIVRVSDPNSRERRDVETRVRDLLAAGVDAGEVAALVLHGEQVDA